MDCSFSLLLSSSPACSACLLAVLCLQCPFWSPFVQLTELPLLVQWTDFFLFVFYVGAVWAPLQHVSWWMFALQLEHLDGPCRFGQAEVIDTEPLGVQFHLRERSMEGALLSCWLLCGYCLLTFGSPPGPGWGCFHLFVWVSAFLCFWPVDAVPLFFVCVFFCCLSDCLCVRPG